MSDPFKPISTVIKSGATVIALLPGVATLIGLVEIPPSVGNLVTFISLFVGLACLLSTALLSAAIKAASGTKIALIVCCLAVLGASSATTYYLFAKQHIFSISDSGKTKIFVSPVNPSPQLQQIVSPFDYDYVEALETSSQRFEMMILLDRESGLTILILVSTLVLAQAASVSAIAVGAWKLAS